MYMKADHHLLRDGGRGLKSFHMDGKISKGYMKTESDG